MGRKFEWCFKRCDEQNLNAVAKRKRVHRWLMSQVLAISRFLQSQSSFLTGAIGALITMLPSTRSAADCVQAQLFWIQNWYMLANVAGFSVSNTFQESRLVMGRSSGKRNR